MANEVKILVSADTKQAEQSLSSMSGKLENMAPKLRGAGMALTGFAVAAVGLGAAFVAAANKVDQAMAVIQSGTGATGKQLANLESIFKTVVATVPVDFNNAANAIGDLNTRLGLTGTELERTAVVALEAGKALGVDTATLIKSTTGAMNAFGVAGSEASRIMDQLFITSQMTGVPIGKLSVSLQDYGPVLKNLGFSLTETVALFGQLDHVGIEVSKVMPAMNAFIRNLAKEGVEDLRGGLADVVEQMQNASTNTEALNIATEAFGSEGAQRLLVAVKQGAFNLDALIGSLKGSQGAILDNAEATRTLSDRMAIFKTRIQLAAAPIGERLMVSLERLMPHLEKLFDWLGNLDPKFVKIAAIVGTAAAAIAGIAGPTLIFLSLLPALTVGAGLLSAALLPIAAIVVGITAAIAAGVLIWKHWDTIVEDVTATFNALKEKVKTLGQEVIDGLIEGLLNPIQRVKDATQMVADSITDTLKSLFGIGSPSTVMIDYGLDMGEGLAIGLERSEGRVADAASSMLEAVKSRFDPGVLAHIMQQMTEAGLTPESNIQTRGISSRRGHLEQSLSRAGDITRMVNQNLEGLGFGDIGQMEGVREMALSGQFDVFMTQHAERLQLRELAKTKKGGDLVLQMMQRVNATSPEWNFTLEEMTAKLQALGDKATETAVAVGRSFQNMDADLHKYMGTLTGEMAALPSPQTRRIFDINDPMNVPAFGRIGDIQAATMETMQRATLERTLAQQGPGGAGRLTESQLAALTEAINRLATVSDVRTMVARLDPEGMTEYLGNIADREEAVTGS